MGYIRNEIMSIAQQFDLNITEITEQNKKDIINNIFKNYTLQNSYPIWEHINDSISVQNPEAWKWLGEFIGNNQVILFFNNYDDDSVFQFNSGHDLTNILGETTQFEIYITDKDANYLICYNHHDFIIAAGLAQEWLSVKLMKFEDINAWLEFVVATPFLKLQSVITKNFNLFEHLEYTEECKVDESILAICREKLKGTDLEEDFWVNTLYFVDKDSFPEELFNYLLENRIGVEQLGHFQLKDEFLWKLVEDVEEAILTLGIRYYTEEKYSLEEFNNFLRRFNTVDWLWGTLLNNDSKDRLKRKCFSKMLFNETNFESFKEQLIEMSLENRLIKTKSIKVINKYYKIGVPRFLKGIAQNPNTPVDILNELIQVKDIKYAKLIRSLASENLRAKIRN